MKQRSVDRASVFGRGSIRWPLLPASLVLGACSADPVDLGDGRLGIDRNALESYAAVWQGYVEAYEFDSGSDRIRIALDEQGNGAVTFGQGEPLPEPTDPEHPFPFDRFYDPVLGSHEVPVPLEGFGYDIGVALVEDERLRASTDVGRIFDAACASQVPVEVLLESRTICGPDGCGPKFSCLPELGLSEGPRGTCYTGLSGQPISCDKARLCGDHCVCTQASCTSWTMGELKLDAALNDAGDRLEGTLRGLEGDDRLTVRLTRVAAP